MGSQFSFVTVCVTGQQYTNWNGRCGCVRFVRMRMRILFATTSSTTTFGASRVDLGGRRRRRGKWPENSMNEKLFCIRLHGQTDTHVNVLP